MSKQGNAVRINVSEKPQEVGRALLIIAATNESYPETVPIYIPFSTLWEIHTDHVIMEQWIANKKNLVY